MFRVFASATLITVLGILAVLIVMRLPAIHQFRACYEQGFTILNEKHTLTASSLQTAEVICKNHKNTLQQALTCRDNLYKQLELSPKELTILENLGKLSAFGTKNLNELLLDHNLSCSSSNFKLQFDSYQEIWF